MILIGYNLYLQVRNIRRSSGEINVVQPAEDVGINASITINRANWYWFIVLLRKNKRKILPNWDLCCAIWKSRACCHNSFEDNLPIFYILKIWITAYSLCISHEFLKSMTSTVTKIDYIFFNLFFPFLKFISFYSFLSKRSHSSPVLINFVLHLLCLCMMTSIFLLLLYHEWSNEYTHN